MYIMKKTIYPPAGYCHNTFAATEILAKYLNAYLGGQFKSMNSNSTVYPCLSTSIFKSFLVSITLFCFFPIKS